MTRIDKSALVSPGAEMGSEVVIGPFCVIGPEAVLGDGCRLHNNVTMMGHTVVGRNNEFFPNTVIGAPPQDLKYKGGPTRVEIGDGNVFREMVTVHAGTELGGGDHNRLLVGVHLAHDTSVGDNCVIANQVQLAGHVHVEDCCHVGGLSAFHHFVTVGRYSYVGGMSRVTVDVPPYTKVAGYRARVRGVNTEGLKRWGLSTNEIRRIRRTCTALFGRRTDGNGGSLLERLEAVENNGDLTPHERYLCDFVRRSLCDGVYGRHLETKRRDSDKDRESYYGKTPPKVAAKEAS
jgi:UDP-N-acetylglucosamine acyltransferase